MVQYPLILYQLLQQHIHSWLVTYLRRKSLGCHSQLRFLLRVHLGWSTLPRLTRFLCINKLSFLSVSYIQCFESIIFICILVFTYWYSIAALTRKIVCMQCPRHVRAKQVETFFHVANMLVHIPALTRCGDWMYFVQHIRSTWWD